jgi:putative membrane protein
MRKTRWMGAALSVVALLSAGHAVAADQGGQQPPAAGRSAAATDGDFLTRALRVNQLELALGRLAAERAASPEVKSMGTTMVEKHSALEKELRELAERSGVGAAPELSKTQRSTFARLSSLSGREFDEAFKSAVAAGHVEELAMYRQELALATDPKLAGLAQRRVATLEKQAAAASPGDRARQANQKNDW